MPRLLEVDRQQLPDLLKTLKRYKLRSKVPPRSPLGEPQRRPHARAARRSGGLTRAPNAAGVDCGRLRAPPRRRGGGPRRRALVGRGRRGPSRRGGARLLPANPARRRRFAVVCRGVWR